MPFRLGSARVGAAIRGPTRPETTGRVDRRRRAQTFTILVLANGVEVKGAVQEVALKKGAEATWWVRRRQAGVEMLCWQRGSTAV